MPTPGGIAAAPNLFDPDTGALGAAGPAILDAERSVGGEARGGGVRHERPCTGLRHCGHWGAAPAGRRVASPAKAGLRPAGRRTRDAGDEPARAAALRLIAAAAKARAGEAAVRAAAVVHPARCVVGPIQVGPIQDDGRSPPARHPWSRRDRRAKAAGWRRIADRAVLPAGTEGLWPMITDAR